MSAVIDGDKETWKDATGDESATLGRVRAGDAFSRPMDTRVEGVALDDGGRLRDARENRVGAERDKVNADRRDAILRCARS